MFRLTDAQMHIKEVVSPFAGKRFVMLYHGTGQGKTCTAIQIAENFRDVYKHCVVIASPALHDNFKHQLHDPSTRREVDGEIVYHQCTGDTYASDQGRFYQFFGYIEFANLLEQIEKKAPTKAAYRETLNNTFANCIFVVDEAHNIRDVSQDAGREDDDARVGATDGKRIIKAFHEIAGHVDNTRFVMLTATPMYDNEMEILTFVNIARAVERTKPVSLKQIIGANQKITAASKKAIHEFASKHVTYLRGNDPATFPLQLGADVDTDLVISPSRHNTATLDMDGRAIPEHERSHTLPIVPSVMHPSQKGAYDDATQGDAGGSFVRAMQASTFVWKGRTGQEGIKQMFTVTNSKKSFSLAYKADSKGALGPERLRETSSKIATVLDLVRRSATPSLVYTQFVWSGVLPIAVALEHAGYRRYGGPQLLAGASQSQSQAQAQAPIYCVLTGTSIKGISQNIAATVAKVNKGEIDVVIATRVASEGLDFKGIRQIHFVDPWYNMSRLKQVAGRGIRTNSHAHLPPDQRNVSVFYHASVVETPAPNKPRREMYDEYVYRVATTKSARMAQVERVLKASAFDCSRNLAHNVRVSQETREATSSTGKGVRVRLGDADNSPECDYTRCALTCAAADAPEPETSWRIRDEHAYVASLYRKHAIRHVMQKNTHRATFQEIHDAILQAYGSVRHDALQDALQDATDHHIEKGRRLVKVGGVYVLVPEETDDPKAGMKYRGKETDTIIARKARSQLTLAEDAKPPDSALRDAVRTWEEHVTSKKALVLKAIAPLDDVQMQAIHDMAWDNMPAATQRDVMAVGAHTQSKELMDSMVRAHDLYVFNGDLYAFNGDLVQMWGGDSWTAVSPARANLVATTRRAEVAQLAKDHVGAHTMMYGYVDVLKTANRFKIIDRIDPRSNATGAVCTQSTNIFNIDKIMQLILRVDPDAPVTKPNGKHKTKQELCVLYEYTLRIKKLIVGRHVAAAVAQI